MPEPSGTRAIMTQRVLDRMQAERDTVLSEEERARQIVEKKHAKTMAAVKVGAGSLFVGAVAHFMLHASSTVVLCIVGGGVGWALLTGDDEYAMAGAKRLGEIIGIVKNAANGGAK